MLGSLIVRHPDGFTAEVNPTGRIRQHGPHRLGDDIAALHQIWQNATSPRPDRYRLTIDPQHQTIWLDDSPSPLHWNL